MNTKIATFDELKDEIMAAKAAYKALDELGDAVNHFGVVVDAVRGNDCVVIFRNDDLTISVCDNSEEVLCHNRGEAEKIIVENLLA